MNLSEAEDIIKESVSKVPDPATGISLIQAGILNSINVHAAVGTVELCLPTPEEDYPYKEELENSLLNALNQTGLLEQINFKYKEMTEEELESYIAQLEIANSDTGHNLPRFLKPSTRIIGISSGKGGVGKSSVTVSLALEMAKNFNVGLLDADIYGFSIPKMLGIDQAPIVLKDILLPTKKWGLRTISMGAFLDDSQPVLWRGPMLHKALEQLINDVHWGYPDYLFIDMPPGTGDVALSLSQLLPSIEFYIVTTPQKAAKRVAGRSAYAAKSLKMPVRAVIENMSYFKTNTGEIHYLFGKGGGQLLADELQVPLLGQIPFDPKALESFDSGLPISIQEPTTEYSSVIRTIAEKIISLGPQKRFRKELKIVKTH